MATKLKTQKNLKSQRSEYNTYYGDFRGVDFSSDHSLVSPNRFAYLVNMYKDYKSKNGTAIETIPGYRKAFVPKFSTENEDKSIYGIHRFGDKVLVHAGKYLLWWKNYPYTCGVDHTVVVELKDGIKNEALNKTTHTIDMNVIAVKQGGRLGNDPEISAVYVAEEEILPDNVVFEKGVLTLLDTSCVDGDLVRITYKEDVCEASTRDQYVVKPQKSVSCSIADKILVFDGTDVHVVEFIFDRLIVTKYQYGNSIKNFSYIPTTYKNIATGISGAQYEYEQRNLLSPFFKNEFVFVVYKTTAEEGDGKEVVKNKHSLRLLNRASSVLDVVVVHADGSEDILDTGNYIDNAEYSFSEDTNTVTIIESVELSEDDTVIVTATWANASEEIAQQIKKCTVSCSFDNRIFLSGNPDYPNRVWFSRATNAERILYFGADDWFDDGFANVPVTGLVPVADKLLVLKADDTDGSSSVYLHSKYTTGDDIVTKAYPVAQGINGIGCVGACTNFFDDPVFVSRRGLDSVGLQTISYERALEHRSTNVDAKLTNMDLSNAFVEELGGYLWLFVDGSVFLADSRQRYTDSLGVVQYEWYYLEGLGSYAKDGTLLEKGKPVCAKNIDDNMFFGTGDGCIFAFNFDKRNDRGEIDPKWYTFDGKPYTSGCATKMDNCGIPHLTKSTVKKSMVAKVKALPASTIKVNVRTNKAPYHNVTERNSAIFSFEDMDFDNFSFLLEDSGIFTIREKEKKWVEKQIYMYSDEPMRPFALYYLAYRYTVAGRYKE